MKTINGLILALTFTAGVSFAGEELPSVPFVLGPTLLKDGDEIVIKDVLATSTNLTIGDKVIVRGRYDLKSHEKASLCLYLTATAGAGEPELPTQTTIAKKGSGEFELSTVVRHVGQLHLSLYGIQDRKDFACVYFGTESQMKKISHWNVSH